jgi:hypothetical protein
MTVFSGSSADPRRRRGGGIDRLVVLIAAVSVVLLPGCAPGSGGGAGASPTPHVRPDEQLRKTISAALSRGGHPVEGDIVARGGSRLTPLRAPFLKSWQVVQVDYRRNPHPVLFHVAAGAGQAYLLTGDPAAFTRMTSADGTHLTEPAGAARAGRLYLETTRPAGILSYVINGVNDIRFRPGITGTDARHRDAITARYRSVVTAPAAVAKGDGFLTTAYVVKDQELQRRDLTVTANGAVRETTRTLVRDLPVPFVL